MWVSLTRYFLIKINNFLSFLYITLMQKNSFYIWFYREYNDAYNFIVVSIFKKINNHFVKMWTTLLSLYCRNCGSPDSEKKIFHLCMQFWVDFPSDSVSTENLQQRATLTKLFFVSIFLESMFMLKNIITNMFYVSPITILPFF